MPPCHREAGISGSAEYPPPLHLTSLPAGLEAVHFLAHEIHEALHFGEVAAQHLLAAWRFIHPLFPYGSQRLFLDILRKIHARFLFQPFQQSPR